MKLLILAIVIAISGCSVVLNQNGHSSEISSIEVKKECVDFDQIEEISNCDEKLNCKVKLLKSGKEISYKTPVYTEQVPCPSL